MHPKDSVYSTIAPGAMSHSNPVAYIRHTPGCIIYHTHNELMVSIYQINIFRILCAASTRTSIGQRNQRADYFSILRTPDSVTVCVHGRCARPGPFKVQWVPAWRGTYSSCKSSQQHTSFADTESKVIQKCLRLWKWFREAPLSGRLGQSRRHERTCGLREPRAAVQFIMRRVQCGFLLCLCFLWQPNDAEWNGGFCDRHHWCSAAIKWSCSGTASMQLEYGPTASQQCNPWTHYACEDVKTILSWAGY